MIKDNDVNKNVKIEAKSAKKDVYIAAELFSKLSPTAQDHIIDLIKSLLSEK